MGRRNRIDQGVLGVIAGQSGQHRPGGRPAPPAARCDRSPCSTGREVVIDADAAEIPVGIDGEAVDVTTPVHCTIRPRALRVRLPRNRPGVPAPKTRIEWDRLWRLAAGRSRDSAHIG